MARIPYADPTRPEAAAVTARIIEQRGGLPHLYAMLLHSVPLADGWLNFLTAVRQRCALPALIRELVIMQVAHLDGAIYEAEQHASLALHEGLTSDQLSVLPNWQHTHLFNPVQRAALAYCDSMTKEIRVTPEVFFEVRQHFNAQLLVELTATIAAYNMVSRFLEAIGIQSADAP